jgi:hypothetical protein
MTENNIIKFKKHETDIAELYSFTAYLYMYIYLLSLFFNRPFIQSTVINILFHSLTTHLFKYNLIHYFQHPYWKYHIDDIVLPQVINSIYNITVTFNFYLFGKEIDFILIGPVNIIFISLLNKIFTKEDKRSVNNRYIVSFLFFIFYFF